MHADPASYYTNPHRRNSTMSFNPIHLEEHLDRDRCSVPLCTERSEITYVPGATPANPSTEEGDGKWLSFCRIHHRQFCMMPAASRHPVKKFDLFDE